MNWSKELPQEEGYFWFYGYRYGRISCGSKQNPELILMENRKIANGFMLIGNGQFVLKTEIEKPHFMPAELPKVPDINS